MSIKTRIVVNLQVPGIHRRANCNIDEVDFLKFCHRHLFYIRCEKSVKDKDREIEIISFKNSIEKYLKDKYQNLYSYVCDFEGMSCEMIAEELLKTFDLDMCEVLEDGENGALITK